MNLQQKKALRFAICFELKKSVFFVVVVAVPSTGKSKDYFETIAVKFSSAWSLRESNIVELCFARETRDSSISLTPLVANVHSDVCLFMLLEDTKEKKI